MTQMSDREIMQKFLDVTESISAIREGQAELKTEMRNLCANVTRCNDHATRLRAVENTTSKLSQNFKIGAWVAGFLLAAVGALATIVPWIRGR